MNFQTFVDEESQDLNEKNYNGADVARELGISRVAVKKITQRAIAKVYKAVKETLNADEGPFQVLVYMSQILNVENDPEGLKLIVKNLDPAQKKEVLDDVRKNYPNYVKGIEAI